MTPVLTAPAKASFLGIPTVVFSVLIPLIGIAAFIYIMLKRVAPLMKAAPDERLDQIPERVMKTLKIWLGQWRQPRYMLAGALHILIFFGFLILSVRSSSLVVIGFSENFVLPGFGGLIGDIYNICKDYAATVVLIACIIAAVRRGVFKPARYAVPPQYGHDHTAEAVFVLGLISILMISESLFEASLAAAELQKGAHAHLPAAGSLAWLCARLLTGTASPKISASALASSTSPCSVAVACALI